MNSNGPKFNRVQLSGFSFWLTVLLVFSLLSAAGLGWFVKSVIIFLALLPVLGVAAVFGLQWWVSRRLVRDRCPVCEFEFAAFKESENLQCPNCGEALQIDDDRFQRSSPPGTIDVQAVDVSVKRLESPTPSPTQPRDEPGT